MRLPTPRLNFLPRIISGLLLVLLAGCSAVQTGYNNAPTLLYWWLDAYIDFQDAQDRPVLDSLEALQAWHRRQELPAYAELLQRLRQQAPQAVTPEQVCTHLAQARVHLQRLGEQSAEGLARLAPTLEAGQLSHLARQFEKHNQKWRGLWLDGTPAELQERRLERTVDRYEDFYGRLSAAQKTLLRQQIATSRFDARLAWTERLRRQQDILAVLQEHRNGDRPVHIKAEMLALVQRSLQPPEPAARAQFERMLQESCENIAALHSSSSPAQRQRLVDRLQGYEADLRALIVPR